MHKSKGLKRVLSVALAAFMLLGLAAPALAAEPKGDNVTLRRVGNDAVSADLGLKRPEKPQQTEIAPDQSVRVSIVLDGNATLSAGYRLAGVAENDAAMAYRADLKSRQVSMAQAISDQALGGKQLDVVWNLTLAANIISANVPYGKLDAIRAVPGVAQVIMETQYEVADPAPTEADHPNMATSSAMIGSDIAHAAGLYGAGSRIAIIDTGTDTDHKSFNAAAFEAAVTEDYQNKLVAGGQADADPTFDEAAAAYGLLTSEDLARLAGELHATKNGATAEELYFTSKLPFGYNYVDSNLDITHDNDTQGEHGSHVAGIATANRLIEVSEDAFEPALDTVLTQGVAPDAQLITMKVFGKNGGAYDSDYMVAIEDAIVLGCDVVNLSLGSPNAGNTISEAYESIMENLANQGLVVAISAGNSGSWAANTVSGLMLGMPYLYLDDVNMDMVGSPGSFTNSLSVASVDNIGATGNGFAVADRNYVYTESLTGNSGETYTNLPFATLDTSEDGTGTEYDYIFSTGLGDKTEIAALKAAGVDLTGKIFFCQRGSISFFEKAQNAADADAAATVIYNNQPGTINMDLSDYEAEAPAVSITLADGEEILDASGEKVGDLSASYEAADDDGHVTAVPYTFSYYTGKMTVSQGAVQSTPENPTPFYTMSDFSSWGVPGDLSLKPEITAPGGNIYSVNGLEPGGEAYENMSGTSMASPQVAGMVALVAQYVREAGLAQGKDVTFTRQLAQSLLMSTAVPVVEDNSYLDNNDQVVPDFGYASVLKQGAGVANVAAAVTANSYVTVAGQPDGKAKVELGEDAQRKGTYTCSFTLHDLNGQGGDYLLDANVFTQAPISTRDGLFLDTATTTLTTSVTFSGADVTAVETEDGTCFVATLPAGGSTTVTAKLAIDAGDKAFLDKYYTSGAYVEAYLFADEMTEDGGFATGHSIPVLGFYGNWTDGSMYDRASYLGTIYPSDEPYPYVHTPDGYLNMEANYLVASGPASGGDYIFGGNPFEPLFQQLGFKNTADAEYIPARNAISSLPGSEITEYAFSPIRNAAGSLLRVVDKDTGEVYLSRELGSVDAAFFYDNSEVWMDYAYTAPIAWDLTDAEGNPLAEDTTVEIQLILAPEYYGTKVTEKLEKDKEETSFTFDWDKLLDGNVRNGELGQGAFLTTQMTVDNTAPSITAAVADPDTKTLTIEAYDNQYIAAVLVYNADGSRVVTAQAPNQQFPGTKTAITLDMDGVYGTKFMVEVYDYAMNKSTYKAVADQPFHDLTLEGSVLLFDEDGAWNIAETGAATPSYLVDSPNPYLAAATDAAGYVFLSDLYGDLYMAQADNIDVLTLVSQPGIVFDDLAYSAADETLYGIVSQEDGPWLYAIDPASGAVTRVGKVGLNEATTLACDDEGNFYSIDEYTGVLYTFTKEAASLAAPASVTTITDAFDAGQSLAWSEGTLYWAQYTAQGPVDPPSTGTNPPVTGVNPPVTGPNPPVTGSTPSTPSTPSTTPDTPVAPKAQARLIAFDLTASPVTCAPVCTLEGPITAMFVPSQPEEEPTWAAPTDQVAGVTVEPTEMTVMVGQTISLTAYVTPWTLTDKSVTWTSSNTSVVTVNADGVATAVAPGTATITAASVLDPTKTATCSITAEVLEYTVQGILQGDGGDVQLFTWDLANSRTYTPLTTDDLTDNLDRTGYASIAKAGSRDLLYIVDGSQYNVYQYDTAGKLLADPVEGPGFPLWDMTYSTYYGSDEKPLIFGVYADDIYFPQDLDGTSYDFENALIPMDLKLHGANAFVAITSMGQYNYHFTWPEYDVDMYIDCERLLALDDMGGLWAFYYNYDEDYEAAMISYWDYLGIVPGLENANISIVTGSQYPAASLVTADDGKALFLTYFDEAANTSFLYVLENAGDDTHWEAKRAGSFGNNIWPASLYQAVSGSVTPPTPPTPPYNPTKPANPVTPVEPDKTFVDVPESAWYAEAVDTVVKEKLMEGISDTEFAPDLNMTRAMVVTVLYRMAGSPAVEGEVAFTDVVADSWYEDAVLWGAQNGIVKGISDTQFAPTVEVSREQLATFFHRYAVFAGQDTSKADDLSAFPDAADVSSWALEAVRWAVADGLVQGTDLGLEPLTTATRAQFATILARYLV